MLDSMKIQENIGTRILACFGNLQMLHFLTHLPRWPKDLSKSMYGVTRHLIAGEVFVIKRAASRYNIWRCLKVYQIQNPRADEITSFIFNKRGIKRTPIQYDIPSNFSHIDLA